MTTKLKLKTALCHGVLLTASIVAAQSPSDDDKHFVRNAMEGGSAEVQLGILAQQII
jgi:hypothetical protein